MPTKRKKWPKKAIALCRLRQHNTPKIIRFGVYLCPDCLREGTYF
jgi:hypothetical protein